MRWLLIAGGVCESAFLAFRWETFLRLYVPRTECNLPGAERRQLSRLLTLVSNRAFAAGGELFFFAGQLDGHH